ncbi:hypothetical protein PB1_16334 [Bacillus methanolicus PB1]|uniref:Uncharacterized protein n=1 Tax=Bacillus methanolicus PB1 TaxID=997296 RepID=I3DY21_BACMT|nr:hypothetical protein [Bacillus methanolicus]EIJ79142.1 hypothetical protein PB1_16334 [Bacillus methanolicus PB1]
MKNFICHCNVRANDGVGHISAKPTVYVEAGDSFSAVREAITQLEEKYKRLGCNYVSASVALVKEI